jgi:hypothetical protein
MRPDVFQLIGYGSLVLLILYVLFFIRRARSRSQPHPPATTAGDAHTEALRENSELLRELIAINRKLLEKQERQDA